jgi:hypothetical protein
MERRAAAEVTTVPIDMIEPSTGDGSANPTNKTANPEQKPQKPEDERKGIKKYCEDTA